MSGVPLPPPLRSQPSSSLPPSLPRSPLALLIPSVRPLPPLLGSSPAAGAGAPPACASGEMHRHSPLPQPDDSDGGSSGGEGDADGGAQARFLWQWDRMVDITLRCGARGGARTLGKHLLWACAQWLLILATAAAAALRWDGSRFSDLLMRNAFLLHYAAEYLGCTGMYSGFSPLFPLTWYRFAPGTLKEPLFDALGDRRTWADVCVSAANVLVPAAATALPPSSPAVALWAGCVLLALVSDFSAYIGAMGCYYGPISAIFAHEGIHGEAGHTAALQVLLLVVYVSCGLSKMGPGFSYVAMLEWTQPSAFAGRAFWQRLFVSDAAAQKWSPSLFAVVLARGAAVVEWATPLLFLCPPLVLHKVGLECLGTAPVDFALLVMCGMHAYIIFHLGSDVNMLNSVTALWCVYVFRIRSVGFDYEDFAVMGCAPRLALLLLALLVALGHLRPDAVCCQTAYRFWAGNWPQAFYAFSPAGLKKLGRIPSNLRLPSTAAGWRACAHIWASQLPARVLPLLLHEVGRSRPQLSTLLPGFLVANLCLGSCSNCALRADQLNARLQQAFGHRPTVGIGGFCGAYSACGGAMRWRVADLCRGVFARGRVPVQHALAISKPSDCQSLAAHLPLLRGL
ncbi:unnamed protein product [Prorocentrum cordatum]|uniref:HTTM domain-containing protein n=1 Tax=Prorocentrum cordatum TaxID=2364126 RepID=A0ABN9V322_9DINO|nr:unnamed protein product [Polarella glacialis]